MVLNAPSEDQPPSWEPLDTCSACLPTKKPSDAESSTKLDKRSFGDGVF
jgi:hypothetical protein